MKNKKAIAEMRSRATQSVVPKAWNTLDGIRQWLILPPPKRAYATNQNQKGGKARQFNGFKCSIYLNDQMLKIYN